MQKIGHEQPSLEPQQDENSAGPSSLYQTGVKSTLY